MSMSSIHDDHLVSPPKAAACIREIQLHREDRWGGTTALPCAFRWKDQLQAHSGIPSSHLRDRLLRVFRCKCIAPTNEPPREFAAECASGHSPIQTSNHPRQCSTDQTSTHI